MPMEVKDIFEANSRNVREMLSERGLGLYVPPYQRPYGWDKEKVQKLVDDILHGYMTLLDDEESFTFLGTVITIHDINFTTVQPIVRPDVPAKVLTVIDGQQRLTSLLLLCLALHNQITLAHSKLVKGRAPDKLTSAENWLNGQALRTMRDLASTFYEEKVYGDAPPYPRMIRAFDDQWARTAQHAQYQSPVARLISDYVATLTPDGKPIEFKPKKRDGNIEGEEALVERFAQIVRILKNVASGNQKGELEELPSLKEANEAKDFQRALLNHEFPDDVAALIAGGGVTPEFSGLMHLLLVTSYVMTRVAVTVVRGKNEHYAFTVFESLNTTGEPLTAFETFKPRVVNAETLARYENSEARKHIDDVASYLATFRVGDELQVGTRDLLTYFAAAETGAKLSKRLADQRRYLKDEFERYEANPAERLSFVRNMRDVATFVSSAWDEKTPSLQGLPVDATSDAVKLSLAFLRKLNHSVTIAPLSRFYAKAVSADATQREAATKDFQQALKAMTAFSVLWRASRRTTGNIDTEYRELLQGDGQKVDKDQNRAAPEPPLARSRRKGANGPEPQVDVARLKAWLRNRLSGPFHGGIDSKQTFITESAKLPLYMHRVVARIVLLAAYHDAVEDPNEPGLIMKGKTAVAPCLSFEGFNDDRHLSLEHIAPQTRAEGWDAAIWDDKDTLNSIGNLVLMPRVENTSASNKPWAEKRVFYRALSSRSEHDAERILDESGIDFAVSTHDIAKEAKHMPHLSAVAMRQGEWDVEFIRKRSERLLGLAWDELSAWLN